MNEYDEQDLDEKINALIGYKETVKKEPLEDGKELPKADRKEETTQDRVLLLHLFGHKLYYNRARFHEIISHS